MKKTKKEWAEELEEMGWPDDFGGDLGLNDWGSCQYDDASKIYQLYFAIRKDLSEKDTLDLLGIKFSFDDIKPIKKSVSLFARYMRDEQKESAASDLDYCRSEKEKLETIKYSKEDEEELEASLAKVKSFDGMFACLKNEAWDLWAAAPFIFEYAFKSPILKGVPKAGGHGPRLNVLSQNENFEVGIMCALLKDKGLVKDETSFAGFDT